MYEELVKRLRNRANGSYEEKCEGCEFTEDFPPCVHCTIKAFNDAADAIEELIPFKKQVEKGMGLLDKAEELLNALKPRWIPVTETLPEDGVYVLGRYKNNEMAVVCVFDHDEDITFWRAQTDEGWEADCDTEPTHWMPLPEPPEGET